MSRLFRRAPRYLGVHRSGVERPPLAQDPWADGEALDPMTDTAVIQTGGVW